MLKKELKNKLLLLATMFFCFIFSIESISATEIMKIVNDSSTIQTLAYAVKQTLLNNPNILESQAQLNASHYALNEVLGEYAPKVDARITGTKGTYDNSSTYENNISTTETGTALYIVQPVFTGLSTKNLSKQRRFEIKAAAYNESYIKEQLSLQAIGAYHEVMRTAELYNIAQDNVKTHQEILRKEQLRYRGGGGNKVDVDLAETRLSQSLDFLHQAEKINQDAQALYLKIVGISPGILQLAELPKVPNSLESAENISLQRNPAILYMKESVNAAISAVDVSKSKLLPQVNIEVGTTNNYYSAYGQGNRYQDLRGQLALNYNLFNGGTDVATVEKTKQGKVATMEKMNAVQRDVIESVSKSWDALQGDTKRVHDLSSRVSAAQKVLDGYKKLFAYGKVSLLDVLNEENELFNSRIELCSASYTLRNDYYALLASMGILVSNFKY